MAVLLSSLVPSLKREVSLPGEEAAVFPEASNTSWVGYLTDAFWYLNLDGVISGYDETAGVITPESGDQDLPRDLQQLIVLYSAITIIRNQIRSLNTLFRAKAGPVEYETQQSAQVLRAILDELKERRNRILDNLEGVGNITSYYIDALAARDRSIDTGLTWWVK